MRIADKEGINESDKQKFKLFKQKTFLGHKKPPTAIDWNESGTRLISTQSFIRIWGFDQVDGLQKIAELKAGDSVIDHAKFCGENLLATMSRDMLKFWDIRESNTSKNTKTQKKSKSDFIKFAWNNNTSAPSIAVMNKQNVVTIYDYRNFSSSLGMIKPSIQINDFCWDKSDSILFLAGGQNSTGSLHLYQSSSYSLLPETLDICAGRINSVSFNRQNTYMATTSQDSLIQLHTVPDLVCERCYSNKKDSQYKQAQFSADGNLLAVISQQPFIEIYNVTKGGLAFRIDCKFSQNNIVWHPRKTILAYTEDQDKKRITDKNQEGAIKLFGI